MGNRLLICDDDHDIVLLMEEILSEEGYEVQTAYNGKEALEKIKTSSFDLILLDMMMPEMDGLEVIQSLRRKEIPIIVISAKDREIDQITALELGADDYLTKPFSINWLLTKIKVTIRRKEKHTKNFTVIKSGKLTLNKQTYQVFSDNELLNLSHKEIQILLLFLENKKRVFTREQIYDIVWHDHYEGDMSTVTVHINNLRGKLGKEGEKIKTVWGLGYKYEE